MTVVRIRIIIVSAIVLAIARSLSYAQEDESFKKYYKQLTQEFKTWRDKANAEFSEYLAVAWKEFMVQRGKNDPVGPVPERPVYYDGQETMPHGFPFDGRIPFELDQAPLVSFGSYEKGHVMLDFYGIAEEIPFASDMRLHCLEATEQDAANGWRELSASDFMPTVDALLAMQRKYSLSDWALYTAVKKLTDAVYIQEYANEKVLTQMFLLNQMQYKARVGSSSGKLVMLLPFTSQIYQVPYITDGGDDYYIFSYSRLNSQAPLYTFSENFSAADRQMDLVIDRQMVVEYEYYGTRAMPEWSEMIGEEVRIPIIIPFVKFTLDYPQSNLAMYHRSDVDKELKGVVFSLIKYKILKDSMDVEEAVAFILGLVQKGFDYRTDYEMFGRAKPLFVEESFYYGANNCKDRVLLFSWLVRELLGLDVVIFCYQGHVACGVAFPENVPGCSYMFEQRRYVMCDPTYIGAPVGAAMPKYRDVQPQIIKL